MSISYYLKIEGSSDTYGVDTNFNKIDLDLPNRDYKLVDTMSEGGFISGTGFLKPRTISCQIKFRGHESSEREEFLLWAYAAFNKEMYLYKEITGFTGKMRVYPMISAGETYKNWALSDSVALRLLAPYPYFESTSLTTINKTNVGTSENTHSITIAGLPTPAIIDFTPTSDFNNFKVKSAEGYSWVINLGAFVASDDISVDMRYSKLTITVNDELKEGLFSDDSTPFLLDNGIQDIYVTATDGSLDIKYYERRL